ncbi:MAG: hypothetical protein II059_01110 [Clostridia bacterium]|jgi:hypothetical protein|nr:hypothetical protein [Clostridia bacterium]
MLTVKNTEVMNFKNAMRGARNPMNSWDRSDSYSDDDGKYILGENDLSLAVRLRKAGSDHRKFLRQIFVSMDITAPMYWWKEFDTYKVGTVANSTSTMHKITSAPFSLSQFSCDKMDEPTLEVMKYIIAELEKLRLRFIETKDKQIWYDIIQLLPSSYDQMRTCTLNYENLINIYHARKNHKLDEWHILCDHIRSLPYAEELIVCE